MARVRRDARDRARLLDLVKGGPTKVARLGRDRGEDRVEVRAGKLAGRGRHELRAGAGRHAVRHGRDAWGLEDGVREPLARWAVGLGPLAGAEIGVAAGASGGDQPEVRAGQHASGRAIALQVAQRAALIAGDEVRVRWRRRDIAAGGQQLSDRGRHARRGDQQHAKDGPEPW